MGAEDAVFRALASEHRRAICDLLRDGPRTTGDLAAELEPLSRFAVMQHLGVLEEAGLVLVRRQGRRRFNYLNAVPIREAYERWVATVAGEAARWMLRLKEHVEEGETMGDARVIRIENEIRLRAPVAKVWTAITTEQLEWYPYTYGQDRVQRLVFEERVGGAVYEDWGDGAGHLYGTVVHFDPQRAYGTRGFLNDAITLEQWATLEADGDETVLRQRTVTFGPIDEEMAKAIGQHGDMKHFEDALRAWVERGERRAS